MYNVCTGACGSNRANVKRALAFNKSPKVDSPCPAFGLFRKAALMPNPLESVFMQMLPKDLPTQVAVLVEDMRRMRLQVDKIAESTAASASASRRQPTPVWRRIPIDAALVPPAMPGPGLVTSQKLNIISIHINCGLAAGAVALFIGENSEFMTVRNLNGPYSLLLDWEHRIEVARGTRIYLAEVAVGSLAVTNAYICAIPE